MTYTAPAHGHRLHTDPAAAAQPAAPCSSVCPGEHNDPARENAANARTPIYGEPIWCARCAEKLTSTLRYLPAGARALEVEIEEATDLAPERVSGTRTRALHEHQAQALLIDEIRDALAQFEDLVREWRCLTPRIRDGVSMHTSIARSATFLSTHQDWILTKAPDTADPHPRALVRYFVEHLRSLDRRAMRLTHQTEAKPVDCIGVPCKRLSCGMKTLVRAVESTGADKGEIVCESCGNRLTLTEYEPWARQWGIYTYAYLDQEQRTLHGHAVAAYERTRSAA